MEKDKMMSAAEAIRTFVKNGDSLAFGGFTTTRKPYGLVCELIRQNKQNLYIESGSAGGDIDMLIGNRMAAAVNMAYIANSGFTQVGRRFRTAVEQGELLYEDYSLDAMVMMSHAAALGVSYVPTKLMLGSDLEDKWGISEEERKRHPKLPGKKYIIQDDPFHPGERLCLLPALRVDAALLHVQKASPDGTCRIEGSEYQDIDLAMAARHTIVSCEELVDNEELHRHPEQNSISGLCVDAVVHMPYGAYPSQCFGYYDYDRAMYQEYDWASKTEKDFQAYLDQYVRDCANHAAYLNRLGAARLLALRIKPGVGYAPKEV